MLVNVGSLLVSLEDMTLKMQSLRDAKSRDLVASAVLVLEAFYFIIATAIITGFGVSYAQGSAGGNGPTGIAALPLVAVGAFAVWSLALLHVMPAKDKGPKQPGDSLPGSPSTGKLAPAGFYLVVAAHLIYGLILITQTKYLLGAGILILGGLLLICSLSQARISQAPRTPVYSRSKL